MASTLTSASTLAQVQAEYDNNSSYVEDNSTAKAKAFITATRILIRRTPSSAAKGSNAIGIRVDLLQKELADAILWLEARDPDFQVGPSVVLPNFNDFRNPL